MTNTQLSRMNQVFKPGALNHLPQPQAMESTLNIHTGRYGRRDEGIKERGQDGQAKCNLLPKGLLAIMTTMMIMTNDDHDESDFCF